jgi:hypothetical protein
MSSSISGWFLERRGSQTTRVIGGDVTDVNSVATRDEGQQVDMVVRRRGVARR